MGKSSGTFGYCIFCGGRGLTKQHLFPQWIGKVLPRMGLDQHEQFVAEINCSAPDLITVAPELQKKRGHGLTRKIRKVCGACNSGWMSKLETDAKQFLEPMILGKEQLLSVNAQKIVASWVAMTSIVAEYTDLPRQAISESDRKLLFQMKEPPKHWNIWIGKYSGGSSEWNLRYVHHGMTAALRTAPSAIPANPNTQVSILVVGHLLVCAISSTISTPDFNFNPWQAQTLVKLWPNGESERNWPPLHEFDDQEMHKFAFETWHQYFLDNSGIP